MKNPKMKWMFSAALALTLSACAGSDKKSPIGERTEEGKTQVVTEQEVTKKVEKETEIPLVRRTQVFADLNEISTDGLVALGVPNDLAKNIVKYREENDGFESVEELKDVSGMNEQHYSSLEQKVTTRKKG